MLFVFDIDGTLIEGFIDTKTCASCKGDGTLQHAADGDGVADDVCPACKGKGKIFGEHLPYHVVKPLQGRAAVLRHLARQGHRIALATNQGGIALGYQTEGEVRAKLGVVCATFDFFYGAPFSVHYAPGHANAKDPRLATPPQLWRRKPNPGMIEEAITAHYGRQRPGSLRKSATIYVGDLATDRDAADAAGVHFAWAEDFFPGFFRAEYAPLTPARTANGEPG